MWRCMNEHTHKRTYVLTYVHTKLKTYFRLAPLGSGKKVHIPETLNIWTCVHRSTDTRMDRNGQKRQNKIFGCMSGVSENCGKFVI